MSEQSVEMVEKAADVVKETASVVETSAQVVSQVAEEADWATVREAAALAGMAALKFVGWWLCSRGFHIWQTYEYEDGTVVDECVSCQLEAAPALAA